MHKVFVCCHHANDQAYKDYLVTLGTSTRLFIDRSVNTGDISEQLSDQAIREKIRDEYLRDSTVTIVLVGTETATRSRGARALAGRFVLPCAQIGQRPVAQTNLDARNKSGRGDVHKKHALKKAFVLK